MKKVIFFICVLSMSTNLFAGRPLSTDDTGTVDVGSFEIEAGYDILEERDDSYARGLGVSIIHGITERADFCVTIPHDVRPECGLNKAAIGMKYALIEDKTSVPDISITWASELGEPGYAFNGIVSKELGVTCIHFNLGYFATGEVDKKGNTTYSLAMERGLTDKLILCTEIVGECDHDDTMDDFLEALIGGSLCISDWIVLDLGIGFGLNNDTYKKRISLGLTTQI